MSLPSQQPAEPPYLLGDSPDALHRLLIQGQMLDPFTRWVFQEAGMSAGMKVLDVGCGPGDVSLIAADLVGKTGSVLGVDSSTEALRLACSRVQETGLNQVAFQEGDILRLSLDDEYDAIVGRLILMHLPDPAAVVHHLTQYLRPGGLIVFQEYDLSGHADAFYPPSSLWEQVWN